MDLTNDLIDVRNFAIALAIGALVGLEREKRKLAEGNIGIGGLRTFILFAAIGAIAAWLTRELATPWVLRARRDVLASRPGPPGSRPPSTVA